MNVKGLKISDILDIDLDSFNRLNEKELRALTSRLVSAGNKRIRRLQKYEINSRHILEKRTIHKMSEKYPKVHVRGKKDKMVRGVVIWKDRRNV